MLQTAARSDTMTETAASTKPEVSTGTTLVGVVTPQGVVLGSDSRVSMGTFVSNRASDKLTQLSDSIYCAQSGSAADAEIVAGLVKHQIQQVALQTGRPTTVKMTAHILKSISYKYKDSLSASAIVAGYDPVDGYSMYSISSSGVGLKVPYATSGSGSWFIYAFLDSELQNPPQTMEAAQQLVKKALSHAMSRDGSSGGIIRLALITEGGVERQYISGNQLPYGPNRLGEVL